MDLKWADHGIMIENRSAGERVGKKYRVRSRYRRRSCDNSQYTLWNMAATPPLSMHPENFLLRGMSFCVSLSYLWWSRASVIADNSAPITQSAI